MARLPSGVYGGWWGLGQSGETDTEGGGLPDMTVSTSSGEVDPSLMYADPGFNIATAPGELMSPEQIAAEQADARTWLQSIGAPAALTAAQVAAAVAKGFLQPTKTAAQRAACPGGYVFPNGDCAQVQTAAGAPLIPGIDNKTLLLVAAGLVFFMILSKSGGGRR